MSVFTVKLNNINQGQLDLDPSTHPLAAGSAATYGNLGTQMSTSKQRQIWVAGPHGTYRLLKDGETFTDCNYWKRFAFPQMAQQFAFIEVTTDDGSVYSDVPEENTFGVGGSYTLDSTYDATSTIDFVTDHGGPATFLQVQNLADSTGDNVVGELNGDTNLTFTLAPGESQIFNKGDLSITMIRLKSDGSDSPVASVISAVRSICYS